MAKYPIILFCLCTPIKAPLPIWSLIPYAALLILMVSIKCLKKDCAILYSMECRKHELQS